jgi:hypothetical protein
MTCARIKLMPATFRLPRPASAGLLLAYAHERDYREREGGYFSRCHLCTDLRRHLAEQGDFKELQPRKFYHHLQNRME